MAQVSSVNSKPFSVHRKTEEQPVSTTLKNTTSSVANFFKENVKEILAGTVVAAGLIGGAYVYATTPETPKSMSTGEAIAVGLLGTSSITVILLTLKDTLKDIFTKQDNTTFGWDRVATRDYTPPDSPSTPSPALSRYSSNASTPERTPIASPHLSPEVAPIRVNFDGDDMRFSL